MISKSNNTEGLPVLSAILRRRPPCVSRPGKLPKLPLNELLLRAVVLYIPPPSPRGAAPNQRSAAPSLPWPEHAGAHRSLVGLMQGLGAQAARGHPFCRGEEATKERVIQK